MVVLVRELNGRAARIAQNGKGAETLVIDERNSFVSSIVGRIVVAYQLAVLFVLDFQIFRYKTIRKRNCQCNRSSYRNFLIFQKPCICRSRIFRQIDSICRIRSRSDFLDFRNNIQRYRGHRTVFTDNSILNRNIHIRLNIYSNSFVLCRNSIVA